MMKCRFKCAALFALCAFSLSEAAAQPADVLRRLHAKYDRVTQFDDGRRRYGILANSGRPILPFEYDEITIFSEWNAAENRWTEAGMVTRDGVQYSFDISKRDE